MDQNGSKWIKMDQNGSRLIKILKYFKIDQD